MTKTTKTQLEPYWHPTAKTVSDEAMRAFAQRLHEGMLAKNMKQADLARAVFGTDPNTGQTRGRGKISMYLKAQGLPGEEKMRKLAQVLGYTLKELAPPNDKKPLETPLKRRAPKSESVSIGDFADLELLAGGKVRLSLLLPNELVQHVINFAKSKLADKATHE